MTVPGSFQPYARTSRYLDMIGPLLQHRDDPSTVALLTDDFPVAVAQTAAPVKKHPEG